jgi:hypothetical protein
MTALAWVLSLVCPVVLDVCDSAVLSTEAQSRRGQTLRSWATRIKALLLRASTRRMGLTYISDRDRVADQKLNAGRPVHVVAPQKPTGIDELDAYEGPADRVVIAADLNSYHNRTAFDWLLSLTGEGKPSFSVPIDLYGPPLPNDLKLTPSITYKGWSPSLASVYEGQTVVFAPNISGMGIQNKVWEAIWAGRPVLVGADAAGALSTSEWVRTFAEKDDLEPALRDLIQSKALTGISRGVQTAPWPSLAAALGVTK